ncbi:hypothetical protein FJTKL_04169 [Diaporthe vaccinii]|uniref:Uncharacterized protein n=1 Tax=Diaporthe vaccinii TaxID=105482 RepID=A0ABR4DTB3_9PEZI
MYVLDACITKAPVRVSSSAYNRTIYHGPYCPSRRLPTSVLSTQHRQLHLHPHLRTNILALEPKLLLPRRLLALLSTDATEPTEHTALTILSRQPKAGPDS